MRRFVANLGGVYGDIEKIAPNPYLNVENREIFYKKNTYTLINPAYFIRNVYNIMLKDYGIKSKITSLKLKNPDNSPNNLEKIALIQLEKGEKEYHQFIEDNGVRKFFYMAPLYVEESCLKCHSDQGYKVGDFRGGIAIYISSREVFSIASKINKFGLAFITTIFLLFLFIFNRYNKKTKELVSATINRESELRKIAEKQKSLILKFNKDRKLIYQNKNYSEFFNLSINLLDDFFKLLSLELTQSIEKKIKENQEIKNLMVNINSKVFNLDLDYLENGEILISMDDITEHKLYLDFLEYFTNTLSLLDSFEFFNELNCYISKNFEIDYVFIGEFSNNNYNKIKTISIAKNGILIENIEYDLENTPCRNVIHGSFCLYDNVDVQFPKDILLQEMGIKGYAGIPLFYKKNIPMGIFVFLSTKNFTYKNLIEQIMKIVSPKITSVLNSIKIQMNLNILQEILVKGNIGILITDSKFNVIYQNNSFFTKPLISLYEINQRWVDKLTQQVYENGISTLEIVETEKNKEDYYIINGYKIVTNQVHYCFIKQEISALKKIEQQLIQAQKMEAIGILSAGIIHDFNNILTGILNYAHLIKLSDLNDTEKIFDFTNGIIKCVDMASNLTKNLLVFTKKHPTELVFFDLNKIIKNILNIIKRTFPSSIEINTNIYPQKLIARINPNQIEQVFMNILLNSKDAMPEGGKINIKSNLQLIEDPSDGIKKYFAVITISDTGYGIPKENLDKIFLPFFTTKEHGKGTGLGLSTAYNIVKQHGGFINVYSEPNIGSTFRVHIPAFIENFDEKEHMVDQIIEIRPLNKSILLIDDENYVIDSLKTLLENKLNCRVYTASNGKEALEIIKTTICIDLIISDILMPVMNGIEFYRELRKLDIKIPIIFLTGYDKNLLDEELLQELEENIKIINKPVNFEYFLKILYDIFPNF